MRISKKPVFVVSMLGILALGSFALAEESFRLVVSAGTLSDGDSYQPFYGSRIFVGEEKAPILIKQANTIAFSSEHAVFYSADPITPTDITAATEAIDKGTVQGVVGHSYRGQVLRGSLPDDVRRYLGAASATVNFEKRIINGKKIIAFSNDAKAKAIIWPNAGDQLRTTPAVIIGDSSGSFETLVVARLVGDLANKLGLVDELMKQAPMKSGLIDLGTNHGDTSGIRESDVIALANRAPMAVFSGTFELGSLMSKNDSLAVLPNVYPFGEHFRRSVPLSRANHGTGKINFWSLSGKENLWPLFAHLGKRVDVEHAIALMKEESVDPNRSLNIVRVFSEDTAREAAKSVYVDLVLLLAKDAYAALPSRETIELKQAVTDAYEQVAPIVSISYLDVSEVTIVGPTLGHIQRVEVVRHPVRDDGPIAKDITVMSKMSDLKGLPDLNALYGKNDRHWQKRDLESVFGGIVLNQSRADIAIFESLPWTTPINGPIPFEMARYLMSPHGNMSVITTTGKQIKRIAKLIGSKALSQQLTIYGIDTKANLIGERAINDNEKFNIALTETALLELFGLSLMGGLGEEYAIRAPFIESIYGDVNQLFFVSGPKVISVSDTTKEIRNALSDARVGEPFSHILLTFFVGSNDQEIKRFIDMPQGRPHHVITLDISYLDIGISKNVANSNYEKSLKSSPSFPISRGKIPLNAHLFLFAKLALNYDAPSLITTLSGDIKYMQYDVDKKPEKDKTKVGLMFRLPWERSLFRESDVVVAPLFKNVYETKLVPNFYSNPPLAEIKDPRTKRFESLLGFNFNFTKLGFNVDAGGLMATDFNQQKVDNALDFGPGVNFFGKWALFGPVELSSDITSYYLFPLPKNEATNKIALSVEGTVWLRLARFHDLSVALISDFLVATLQETPSKVSLSSIFGLTISYGHLFRLFG